MNSPPLIAKPLELEKNDIVVSERMVWCCTESSTTTSTCLVQPHSSWQLTVRKPKYRKCISSPYIYASQIERNMLKKNKKNVTVGWPMYPLLCVFWFGFWTWMGIHRRLSYAYAVTWLWPIAKTGVTTFFFSGQANQGWIFWTLYFIFMPHPSMIEEER